MGVFELNQGCLHMVSDWALCKGDEVFATVSDSEACVVTSDWDRCSEVLQTMFSGRDLLYSGPLYPRASDLLSLHGSRLESGIEAESPLPIYLHPPVARPVSENA